jgi:hypothetical protein
MINDLDFTLEKLLKNEFDEPLPFDLSFAIPDKSFAPVTSTKNTLNCYLYDIREDLELRNVEPRLTRNADGTIKKEFSPARVKLSYCITAWSPAQPTPGMAPAIEEHRLLGDVLKRLLKYPVLPQELLVGDLGKQNGEPLPPVAVIRPQGPKNMADFWNAIGGQLRPSLDYSVTVSLDFQDSLPKLPAVSSAQVAIGPREERKRIAIKDADRYFTIGGFVRDSRSLAGITAARVRLKPTGRTVETDADGCFVFDRVSAGDYELAVSAVDFHERETRVEVPLPSDKSYEVNLDPLV